MSTPTIVPDTPLVFRCDATASIGYGHVMRCLALAETWRKQDGQAVIIGQIDAQTLHQRMQRSGIVHLPLSQHWDHPTALFQLQQLLLSMQDAALDSAAQRPWLVLDGYHFDTNYQHAVRSQGYNLCVVDDIAHLAAYDANILLNQNIGSQDVVYTFQTETHRLCGPDYVMLRSEFLDWRAYVRPLASEVQHILITLGGTDMMHQIPKTLRALSTVTANRFRVKVVLGYGYVENEDLAEALRAACTVHDVELLKGVDGMPGLMAQADLAISAAGSTTYELAFMGVPMILLAIADNQLGVARGIHAHAAGVYLGWYEDVSENLLASAISELNHDPVRRSEMGDKGRALVDGKGCSRVLQSLVDYSGPTQ